jgi:hypothetical protein
MQYLLLIYDDEKAWARMSPADVDRGMAAWWAFDEAVKKSGVYVAGNALKPTDTATTVRVGEGKPLKTDGPFAETKEQLGGYYLLDVPDLDTALRWAEKMPHGTIEIRPIMVFDQK